MGHTLNSVDEACLYLEGNKARESFLVVMRKHNAAQTRVDLET